jgi:GNAT superfamily N-acetyltransferase
MTTVRRAVSDDWRLLRQARLAGLLESPSAFRSSFEVEDTFDEARWRAMVGTGCWFLAVDSDGTAVGVAAGVVERGAPPDQRHLVAMWIAPTHRGRGIAGRLVRAVAAWARDDGAGVLSLWVRRGNEPAHRRYTELGFDECAPPPGTQGGACSDEVRMELPLRAAVPAPPIAAGPPLAPGRPLTAGR